VNKIAEMLRDPAFAASVFRYPTELPGIVARHRQLVE
jgi:hypothetical protein